MYFQYILWGYLANEKNDQGNFVVLQPEANEFIQANPDLVNFYWNDVMNYGVSMDSIKLTITNQGSGAGQPGQIYGPFTISANLNLGQKQSAVYNLSKMVYNANPVSNSNYYKFVNQSGTPITKVSDGQPFYLEVSEGLFTGNIEFLALNNSVLYPMRMNNVTNSQERYNLELNGLPLGRYQTISNDGIHDGHDVRDTLNQGNVVYAMCAELNTSIVYGIGFDTKLTDANDIAQSMGISKETLYRLRYIFSLNPDVFDVETLTGKYPESYTETSDYYGPVLGVGGTSYFNQNAYTTAEYFKTKIFRIAQNVFWYAEAKESGDAKYTMPVAQVESLESNPEFIKFFYDPEDPSKKMEDLAVNNIPTVTINKNKATLTGEQQEQLMGPFLLKSESDDSFALTFDSVLNPGDIQFLDENKNQVDVITSNQQFYLLVKNSPITGNINIKATSIKDYLTFYSEELYVSPYNQNLYALIPNKEKIETSQSFAWNNNKEPEKKEEEKGKTTDENQKTESLGVLKLLPKTGGINGLSLLSISFIFVGCVLILKKVNKKSIALILGSYNCFFLKTKMELPITIMIKRSVVIIVGINPALALVRVRGL